MDAQAGSAEQAFVQAVAQRAAAGEEVPPDDQVRALHYHHAADPTDPEIGWSLMLCLLRAERPVSAAVARAALARVLAQPDPQLPELHGVAGLLREAGETLPWDTIREAVARWLESSATPAELLDRFLHLVAARGGNPTDELSRLREALSPRLLGVLWSLPPSSPLRAPAPGEPAGPGLDEPLTTPGLEHAAPMARFAARALAAELPLDPARAEPVLAHVFASWERMRLPDVVWHLDALGCVPGYPFLGSRSAEALMYYLIDAAHRGRAALDRGVGPVPMLCFPKTASASIAATLGLVLNLPVGCVALDHRLLVRSWLAYAAERPLVLHDHAFLNGYGSPTLGARNDEILRACPPRRVALHLRDPREVLVSRTHHAVRPASGEPDAHAAFARGGLPRVLDLVLAEHMPHYGPWLEDWLTKAGELGIEVLVTRYEEFAADPRSFMLRLLHFFGAPATAFDRVPAALAAVTRQNTQGGLNFRAADREEWRAVLTAAQLERLRSVAGERLVSLYAL